jgi:hypothetical protein
VTLAAVALSLANSGAYVVHRNALAFGVLLALTDCSTTSTAPSRASAGRAREQACSSMR